MDSQIANKHRGNFDIFELRTARFPGSNMCVEPQYDFSCLALGIYFTSHLKAFTSQSGVCSCQKFMTVTY